MTDLEVLARLHAHGWVSVTAKPSPVAAEPGPVVLEQLSLLASAVEG